MNINQDHKPVLLNKVIEILNLNLDIKYNNAPEILDGTLGAGGYSCAVLENFLNCNVTGIDQDENALNIAREKLLKFNSRIKIYHAKFSDIKNIFPDKKFNAFMFDLGVSNMQLVNSDRGFSFNNNGPLDMRMNPENNLTASDVLFNLDVDELTKIFREYGEERFSKLIARAIKNYNSRIETTGELVKIIREALPKPVQRKIGTHPARRIFQALRIYVNNEHEELKMMLDQIPAMTFNNAVIIIVSYHSGEDRTVKNKFREWQHNNLGKILTKHPIAPDENEINENYKSRSAKLRAFKFIFNQ
mgnify:CR=1 FL=1